MKKLILLLTVFAFALTANVFAQETADVTVEADVQAALAITVANNVVFGTIQQAAASLDRASASASAPDGTNLGSTANLGVVDITGSNSATVLVNYTNATLDTNPTSDVITFTTEIRDVTNSVNINSGDSADFDGSGNLKLHIGGSLAAPSGTGIYNTTNTTDPITVTVQYL